MTNQFKLGKCMTRGGEEVRILDIDDTNDSHASIVVRLESGGVSTHYPDGRYTRDEEHEHDLLPNNIEVVRVVLMRHGAEAPQPVTELAMKAMGLSGYTQCSDTIEIPVRGVACS